MAYVSEILFVDPLVDDRKQFSTACDPGVEAIVLDPATPASRQIARARLTAFAVSTPCTSSLTARRAE